MQSVPWYRTLALALTQGLHTLLAEQEARTEGPSVNPVAGGETLRLPPAPPGPEPAGPSAGAIQLVNGEVFAGRYRVERILDTGGMGTVAKAHDLGLNETVALKVIRPEFKGDPVFLERLKQEIKLARRISHKHVLRTHDFGQAEGIPFVTMEYLQGVTLKQLLEEHPQGLPQPLVLRIGRQVAEGLQAAHAQNVVHRDLKPANVMFDGQGDVRLMDFGLAAPVSGGGTDGEGRIFGTPGYMAPEQILGDPVDPRTDLYALGVLLFELATGSAPFHATEAIQVLNQHLKAEPPEARERKPELGAGFALLLRALMAKDKDARPASATEVLALLDPWLEGEAGDLTRTGSTSLVTLLPKPFTMQELQRRLEAMGLGSDD